MRGVVAFSVFLAQYGLRPHEIIGDAMAPTLLAGDVVLIRPIVEFYTEGLYLVGDRWPRFYRVAKRVCCSDLTLLSDNRAYPSEQVKREWFREHVLGIAAFHISPLGEFRKLARRTIKSRAADRD